MNKNRVGRTDSYTNAKAEEILERLAAGESLNKICKSKHLPPYSTVLGWVKDDGYECLDRCARTRGSV